MVSDKINIKDKHRSLKKTLKFLAVILVVTGILAIAFLSGWFSSNKQEIVLEHPLKNIVFENTNNVGLVNKEKVVEEAVINFNENYINYILLSLGVNNLHKSLVGYGNPKVEFAIDNEIWSTEVSGKRLVTKKEETSEEDIRISTSKENIVEILLSENIDASLENSLKNGNIQLEQVAGKVELASKGYLAMYKEATGEEIELEE